MTLPWSPIIYVDILGSALMLGLSGWCALFAWQLTRRRPDDIFRNYLFLFTLAILFFAVSRSFGHLVKQLLLLNGMDATWKLIAPFSGAVNSTTFVVIFALGISFHRFQRVHAEVDYYKGNLEELITKRTEELERSRNTLANILNNTNPINITGIDFDLLQANAAYYALWPKGQGEIHRPKCYESRPGANCDTDECPLRQIMNGAEEVIQDVTKQLDGQTKNFILTAKPFRDVDGSLIGMVESFQDITLLKQAEKALREREELFRQIFESNPDPVILARAESGAIIDVNQAFVSVSGIPRHAALNHSTADLHLWADPNQREQFRQELLSQGAINNYEVVFRVADDQEKTGLVSARALTVNNEPCILTVIRDITTEKAAEQALIEMDRMKNQFISTAAHELNTPLSTIMGYTEFLKNPVEFGGFTDEQKQDFVNEIHDRGEALCRIIEDLLDISRIESGNPVPLVREETDLLDVLRKKVTRLQLQDKAHRYRLELPASAGQTSLWIDRHRIEQALDNLLSNAMKYSPEGTEIVLGGDAQPEGWTIRVVDQGIGMNAEQLDRIFDKFYRADTSNTATSGLGLGMSIVKQIIEAHDGRIWIESVEGKGTTAFFFLPFQPENPGPSSH